MKLICFFIIVIITVIPLRSIAQRNNDDPWFTKYFYASGVSYASASVKINNEPASYEDLLNLKDSAILKIEVYDKKLRQNFLEKMQANMH